MKKLFALVALLVLLMGIVPAAPVSAAGTTILFNDDFTSGFTNWSSTTTTNHGALTNPAQSLCDDYLPPSLGPCMGAYTGLPNQSGVAFATYVYGVQLDSNEYNASWKTYLQTFTDNGTTIGLFSLRDNNGLPIFVLQDSPDGLTDHSLRVGCKKNDGTWIYSAWTPISPGSNPFGPYEITVNWKADSSGVCGYSVVHLPTGIGVSQPSMPSFNNSGYLFYSVSLGVTTIVNGMRFKVWNDYFRSYHNFTTGILFFEDDFETPWPLVAPGRWDSAEGNPSIPTDVCDSPVTPLSHCLHSYILAGWTGIEYVRKNLDGVADNGGVRVTWTATLNPDDTLTELMWIGGQGQEGTDWRLVRLQAQRHLINGLYYPQVRILCIGNDGNWYSQAGGGWVTYPHYPLWGQTNIAMIKVEYKQEPSGTCSMSFFDFNGPADWQNVTYFAIDNSAKQDPDWVDLGLPIHPSSPADYEIKYDNVEISYLRP